MSMPDPVVGPGDFAWFSAPQIVAQGPNNASYRQTGTDGGYRQLDIQQTATKGRKRHYVRLTLHLPGVTDALVMTDTAFTFIIDEPAVNGQDRASILSHMNLLFAVLSGNTNANAIKLLNGEA